MQVSGNAGRADACTARGCSIEQAAAADKCHADCDKGVEFPVPDVAERSAGRITCDLYLDDLIPAFLFSFTGIGA